MSEKPLKDRLPQDYKDRTPIILVRVSTAKQIKGMPTQQRFMEDEAKNYGFKKKPVVIAIRQSGKQGDLKTLKKMREVIAKNPRKKFAVFVRDTPRFARNLKQAILALEELSKQDIPLIPLDMRVPVFYDKTPLRKMTFSIFMAVAEGAKAPEQDALQTAVAEARKRGIPPSPPQDSYSDLTKGKPNIYRQINALRPAIAEGSISRNAAARAVGLLPQQFRKMLAKLEKAEEIGGQAKLTEWLEVWDAIVDAERQRGIGKMSLYVRNRSKTKALHRVVIGYLRFPDEFPRPDTVGNPDTATFPPKPPKQALGTIQDALDNPEYYQPTR